MKFIIEDTYEAMSQKTADMMAEILRKNPKLVAALPTGGTPERPLELLAQKHKDENLDFSQMKSFNIDEYVPLAKENPQGYYYFLNEYLYSKVNINYDNTFVPDISKDIDTACAEFEQKIEDCGNLDFILLGIGNDGHIGFNEPAPFYYEHTHLVDLDQGTIEANSRFFDDIKDVPTQAITLGMATILKAEKIILIANGEKKANGIRKLFEETTIYPEFPASFLRLHRDVTIVVDKEAAKFILS